MRSLALVTVLLCCSSWQLAAAQRLTGNLTGASGTTCSTDAANPFGSGCPKGEGCCPGTNTCMKITSCADFAKSCLPPSCAKEFSFNDAECPVDVTKAFRTPKDLKCYESKSMVCSTNTTHMLVACRSSAAAAGAQLLVLLLSATLALALL